MITLHIHKINISLFCVCFTYNIFKIVVNPYNCNNKIVVATTYWTISYENKINMKNTLTVSVILRFTYLNFTLPIFFT